MATLIKPTPSVPAPTPPCVPPQRAPDVTIAATFSPSDPLALTTVDVDAATHLTHDAYLDLIDAAIERLRTYRDDYAAARAGAVA